MGKSNNDKEKKKIKKRLILILTAMSLLLLVGIGVYNKIVIGILEDDISRILPDTSAASRALMVRDMKQILWPGGFIMVALILVMVFLVLRSYYQREKYLQSFAMNDKLTGLLNWTGLKETAGGLIPAGKDYALVLFHINYFKRINNMFGFEAGGRLLKDVAAKLKELLSEQELMCRISEDNYAMLLRYGGEEELADQLNHLFEELEKVTIKEKNITYNYQCTYTGGVCLIKEMQSGETISDIKDRARAVMESYGSARVTRWKCFDEESKQEMALKRELEKGIIRAINDREFVPYYQPQFELSSNEVVGAEILARWIHPEHGLILPKQFISLLERAGYILELDMNMLEAGCRQLKSWMDQGLVPVPVMVNISWLNIHRQDFLDRVLNIVKSYRVPTNLIALEISETVANNDTDKVFLLATQLKSHGFLLIMDDAGSGKITLDALNKIPLDYIKVEKEFVLSAQQDERRAVVLSYILRLTRELKVSLMVKNVETKEQADYLRSHGCIIAQGQYFAGAMEETEFEKIVFESN